jgi:cellulose synthase/poly-beta-1,6-N-acetylglucosamine synthase-like glycosyltransferase
MNRLPDVSVVMSVYNGADRLHETLESVLSQQGVSLEFIIVDDGSTDRSDIILANYASHDSRVQILYQSNQGLTHALIRGCGAAKENTLLAKMQATPLSLTGFACRKRFLINTRTAFLLHAGLLWSAQLTSIYSRARVEGARVAPSVYCLKRMKSWW